MRALTIRDRTPPPGDVLKLPQRWLTSDRGEIGGGPRRRVLSVDEKYAEIAEGWICLTWERGKRYIYARRKDGGPITTE